MRAEERQRALRLSCGANEPECVASQPDDWSTVRARARINEHPAGLDHRGIRGGSGMNASLDKQAGWRASGGWGTGVVAERWLLERLAAEKVGRRAAAENDEITESPFGH